MRCHRQSTKRKVVVVRWECAPSLQTLLLLSVVLSLSPPSRCCCCCCCSQDNIAVAVVAAAVLPPTKAWLIVLLSPLSMPEQGLEALFSILIMLVVYTKATQQQQHRPATAPTSLSQGQSVGQTMRLGGGRYHLKARRRRRGDIVCDGARDKQQMCRQHTAAFSLSFPGQ